MPRVVFLQLDCGGRLEHVVSDLAADGSGWDQPEEGDAAGTVVLYGPAGEILVAEQDCEIVEPTTLEDAAAVGATTIPVAEVVGLRRWDQIVVGPSSVDGRWEWATIDGLLDGGDGGDSTIRLLAPLRYAYADGDAVGSRALAIEFDAADVGSVLRKCRAEWRYLQGGLERRESTIVHCSRYAPRYALSESEVETVIPSALRKIGPHQRLGLILRQVWERTVLPTIARLMPPGGLASGEAADELLLAAVARQICEAAREFDAADRWAAQYEQLLGGLPDAITDIDEDGVQSTTEGPRSRRAPRMLRAG